MWNASAEYRHINTVNGKQSGVEKPKTADM
jgi:hypothetical protein